MGAVAGVPQTGGRLFLSAYIVPQTLLKPELIGDFKVQLRALLIGGLPMKILGHVPLAKRDRYRSQITEHNP
jgi:hypothetical protein